MDRAIFLGDEEKALAVMGKRELRTSWSDGLGDVVVGEHDSAGGVEIGDGDGRFEIGEGGRRGLLFFWIVVIEILLFKFRELVGCNLGAAF